MRRGQPQRIRSDNGSNFVRGEKELREAIQDWNQEKIYEFLLAKNIKWVFNPPAGSHHGGIWERCIRTTRKVMKALLQDQPLDDEGLLTLLCEVESIINGRPLTKVSDDPRVRSYIATRSICERRQFFSPEMAPCTVSGGRVLASLDA